MRSPYLVAVAAGISAFLSVPVALSGDPLAAARLHIRGSRLTIHADAQANDADQFVSVGEQARVRTCYGAVDEPCGAVVAGDPRIAGLEVVADLSGPELPRALELRTVPGGAFVLPVFQREGEYRLDNIRLTNRANGAILGWCEPPAAELHVAQVVLTSATVTRLNLADLQERGIHLSQESYQAFDFAVGFAIAGEEVTITLPVLYAGGGEATPLLPPEVILDGLPDEVAAIVSRWQPPKVVPFVFEPATCDPQREERCREQEVENHPPEYPLFGAIVIPGTVSFLHQFFDARLIVANGAPVGNDAMLADLTASLKLPAGHSLRLAVTDPPVAVGQRVPLVAEDGASVIAPGKQAVASWTVEGLKAGTHTLQWELTGELRRNGKPPMTLASKAQGLVEVVDARFHLAFSHPDVVRENEPYTLFVTISNMSRAPQEAISVTLEHRRHHEESLILTQHVDRLDTGESETLEFGLVSDVTGKVYATTFQVEGEEGSGSIRLHTAVGELGIPLSPASLVLPRFTERLGTAHGGSDALLRANIRLLGLAYSLATAPAGVAPGGLPQLTTPAVERRAWDLAEAGRRTFLHDGLLESLEVLALDQLGNRHPLAGLDELRRASGAGAEAAAALAGLIRQEQVERGLDAVALLDHFARTTSYAQPYLGAVLVPEDASQALRLSVRQDTPDGAFCLADGDCLPGDRRGLPFGELLRVSEYPGAAGTAPVALVGHVDLGAEFQILAANATAAPARGRLVLIVPDGSSGAFRRIDLGTVDVPAWSTVAVVAGASVADVGSGGFGLFQLSNGAPVPGAAPAVQQTVEVPDFVIQGAVQDYRIAAQDIHGSAVVYLFNRPPAGDIGQTPSAFAIRSRFAGLDVHGQPVARDATKVGQAAFLQDDGRVLLVRYSGPISPFRAADGSPLVAHEHLIDNNAIEDRFGHRLTLPVPPVETETAPLHVGGLVAGRVVRGNGSPAAGSIVELLRVRYAGGSSLGRPAVDVVERVATDAEGDFYFDCVEQPHWSASFEDSFTLRATVLAGADPVTEPAAVQEVSSTIRQQGRLATINIALLGRGTVTGRLVWADTGAPIAGGTVIAASTLFSEMSTVSTAPDGTFNFSGVPVGPITITGRDADGHSVYATVGISSPGAVADVVLELQRGATPGTGTILGSVVRRRSAVGGEEVGVEGADVALYSAGRPFAQDTTDASGRFRFNDVPEGQVTVQAASWAVSRTSVITDLILSAGETRAVKVVLSESLPRAVVGSVFFLDPVLGAPVPVVGAPVFIPGPGVLTYTAADGSYRLEGVPVQGVTDAPFTVTAIDYGRQLEGRTTLAPVLDGSPDEIAAETIVLRPQLGGLDGVVLDPLGRPYDGAEVVLFPIAIKSSGSGGKFSFNDVPIGAVGMTGEPRLIAHVANGMQIGKVGYFGGASTQVVYGGHRPFVTVRMRGSGIVRVMTKTHAGDLIQSLVSIRPTLYVEGEKVVRASPTFLEMAAEVPGAYEMEIPVGEFQVNAYNPFHGVETINGVVAYPGQVLEYTVTFAATGTVTGTVLDVDGVTPVPRALVTLHTETFHPQPVVADDLGRFSFGLVPPGNVMVTASAAPGGVERVGAILGSITVPGQVVDLPVRLKARGAVSGRVVELTASGLVPVPYAQVQVHEYSYPNRRVPAGGGFVLAGPDGWYQVSGLYSGAVGVVARDGGQVTREGSVSGLLTTDWQVVELPDIVLSTSVGTLSVVVRDGRTGEPVPDCQVTLGSGEATISDGTGAATFEALPLGVYSVYAFHAPSGRGGRANALRLENPGEHVSAVVSLDQTGAVRGTLFDDPPMSVPVAGAVVELRGSTAVGELRALATTEGAGGEPGRFAFAGIPEGSFTLTAARAGSPRRAGTSVELTALSPIAEVALVLEPVGDLNVRVLERLREGVTEIDTREVALSVAVEQDGYAFTQISPGAPYPDHAFVFPNVLLSRNTVVSVQELAGELRSGRLALLEPRALDAHGGDGSAGNPHRLVLGAKGVVRVTVRDAAGTLVPGASVSLTASTGAPMSAAAGAAGAELGVAVFLAVPAGPVTASAWLPGTAVGGTAVGVLEDDDQIVDLAVIFAPTVAVFGTVRQPAPDDVYAGDGSSLPPQAGAAVELSDAAAVRQTAVTGADGSFRFVGVAPGWCTVKAWQPGGDGRAETSAMAHGPNGTENVLLPLVLDGAPPRIVSITPSPGMDRVSRSAAIEIVFSEPLAPSSLPGSDTGGHVFALRSASGRTPAGAWNAAVDLATRRQHVTFTPSEPYDNFTVYGLTVDAGGDGVRDLAGRLLAESGSVGSNFKTADTVGPEVIGTLPEVSRPVPPLDPLRIDFNEALTVSEEALDGDGTDDAGELYWERDDAGVVEWRPYPAGLHLTRNGYSLSVTPADGLVLTGDTLRRRVVVSRLSDASGNVMAPTELAFRVRDANPPLVTVPYESFAPAGMLTHGMSYTLRPQFAPGSIDFITETPPAGDVDRVEYFLVDPTIPGSTPAFVSRTYPFEFTFVAAYSGDGTTPRPFPVWVRAVDNSENAGCADHLPLAVVNNLPPGIAAVSVSAVAPVAGVPYAGSTLRAVVAGVGDPDGNQVTLSVELWREDPTSRLATAAAVLVPRPASGSWSDLTVPSFDLTLPADVAEGTTVFIRARAIDSQGALAVIESERFAVADDARPPTVDGVVARRSWPAPAGVMPPVFVIGDRLYLEFSARDAETGIRSVNIALDPGEIFAAPLVATRVPGSASLFRTNELTVPADAFTEETIITAFVQADDHDGNIGEAALALRVAPSPDHDAPAVEWLTPWEGAAWPAAYTSVVSTEAGIALLLRARASDTIDDGAGGSLPGSVVSVEFRAPASDGLGGIVAGEWVTGTEVDPDADSSHGVYECVVHVPNDIPTGSALPFEARVVDTGNLATVATISLTARAARRVWESVETAVLPTDPMTTAGGDPNGPLFLLDGATVAIYPADGGASRSVSSLFLFAGGEGAGPVTVHASTLTAPKATSYASTVPFYPLALEIAEALVVGAGCAIDVSGLGLLGNTSQQSVALPGETVSGLYAGGSHGGKGWFGSPWDIGGWERTDLTPAGSVYDSLRDPHLPGSGGTSNNPGDAGGRGGGVVRLLADSASVRLAGDIRADGERSWRGGGAGGAVLMRAHTIEGSGRITAAGGDGSSSGRSGGGGGGRIAVLYREEGPGLDLAGQTSAAGGADSHDVSFESRRAGAGTIYLEQLDPETGSASGIGRLLVTNTTGKPAAITPLPALGDGTLLEVDTSANELIVEAPDAIGECVGEWVVATDGTGAEVAALRIVSQTAFEHAPGSPRGFRLGVEANAQLLTDLSTVLGISTVTIHGRNRLAALEGRGAARIVVGDDVAIGEASNATPPLNDRSSLTLDAEARALLRGEGPVLQLDSTPPAGSDVPVGSSIEIRWTVSDPLGLATLRQEWSRVGPATTSVLVEPTLVDNAAAPHRLAIGGAPAGPVRLSLAAADIAGRSQSGEAVWNVLPNQRPTVTLSFPAGTPAAVLPGQTVTVLLDLGDAEGLQQVTLHAIGPVSPADQTIQLTGTSEHLEVPLAVSRAAQAGESVTIQAEVLDRFGTVPVVSAILQLVVLADAEPPTLTVTLTPTSSGDLYTAGDVVTIASIANDNVGVSSLSLSLDGQVVASSAPSLMYQWTAPPESTTAQHLVEVTAIDYAGNVASVSRTVSVQPLVNPSAPSVVFICPSSGAMLPAGYAELVLQVQARDDIGVAAVEFYRHGEAVPFATARPAVGTPQEYQAAATAPPLPLVGAPLDMQFRVRARDASNNFTDAYLTVHVVDATTIDAAGNNDWQALAGTIGVLRSGVLTLDTPRSLGGLIVLRGASITHPPTAPGSEHSVDLVVNGPVYIECGASVDVTARGYAPGVTYPGEAAQGGADGGSHMGLGGLDAGPLGSTFGSVYRPQEAGAGGRLGDPTRGGGTVRLSVAGSAVVDGTVRANGGDGTWGGLGAGGSVWLSALGTVSGHGTIEARGGDGSWHGAGGGGAITVAAGVGSPGAVPVLVARGGTTTNRQQYFAGAGTTLVHGPDATFGDLIVDNGGIDGQATVLPALGAGFAQEGSGGTVLVTERQAIPEYFVGHAIEVVGPTGTTKGTWQIASIAGRTVTLEANTESGDPAVAVGDHWEGVYRFDRIVVRGGGKLDSQDGARVGSVTVEPGSQLLWFDQTPPVIDATRISLRAHDRQFWVAGEAGAVVDPGGLTSATVRNLRTGETVSVTLNGGGGFAPTPVAGMSDDGVELVATSAHQHPAKTTATLGTLPANLDAPTVAANLVEVVRDSGGQRRVVGLAGAGSDAEFPVTLVVGNLGSEMSFTAALATDGSFNIPFEGSAGDLIRLTASDGHPQTRSTTIELGALAGNSAPLVDTARISVTYEPPVTGGEDPRPAAYVVHFADGALSDPEMPIQLEIPYPDGSDAWTEGTYSEWRFDWRLDGGRLAPGMTLTLIATDSHPGEPLSTTVQIGPLPIDNYGPPAVDLGRTSLLPLGLGFQVAGRDGAVVDPDGPVTVTLSDPQSAWTSGPLTVAGDGSFYARVDGNAGDEIFIRAADSHGEVPLATEPISLGFLPDAGMTISEVALEGHVATRLRSGFVVLDGGTAAAWPWLRWYLDEALEETVAPLLTGLTAAADMVWSERVEWPLVLDGTDVVAWVCTDDVCPTQSPGRMTVSAGGALTRGLAHAGYLFLASQGAASSLHVLSPPFIDATGAVTPACGGAVATLVLPVPAGTHVLEVFPGYPGEIAVLTDQPAAEVLIVDVTDPMAPTLSRTIDLAGEGVLAWGVWERGELLLGRSGGGIELWRWGSGTLTPWAVWQPVGAAARGAARMGDQLWVGLADGRLQQVDLLDPAQPHLVGEVDLGAGVVAVSDLGGSLLVATDSSLLHVWARVMPPEINPGEVTWGHRPGLSWARTEVASYENVDRTTVLWEGLDGTYDSQTSLYTVELEIATAPTVRAVDEHGVPGGPFTPTDWQTWGDWLAVGSEWFPTGAGLPPPACSASVTTAGAAPGLDGNIPWLAAAPTGSTQVDLAFSPADAFVGSSPPLVSALAASGVVTELVSFGETLLVLDDGLGVWDVGDPAAPSLLSHTELFGGDPVAAAQADTRSWPPSIAVAAGTPLRIVVVGVGDPRQPEIGGEAVLPDVVEPVVDIARVRESEVVTLLGGGGRLMWVNAADPQAPVPLADQALPPGPAPVALAVHCDSTESGCGAESLVAVVRDGWGVEIYALGDLQLLHAVPLDGTPRDVLFARDDGGVLHLLVTLGFGHGVASVTGLPAAAAASDLHLPGVATTFVQHDSGRSGLDDIAIATPTGIVQLALPCRLEN